MASKTASKHKNIFTLGLVSFIFVSNLTKIEAKLCSKKDNIGPNLIENFSQADQLVVFGVATTTTTKSPRENTLPTNLCTSIAERKTSTS